MIHVNLIELISKEAKIRLPVKNLVNSGLKYPYLQPPQLKNRYTPQITIILRKIEVCDA